MQTLRRLPSLAHFLPVVRVTRATAILVAFAAVGAVTQARAADPETSQAVAPVIPTVTVSKAAMTDVQHRVPVTGSLVARTEVQVYPQVSGHEISELLVDVGDRVTAGQPLAKLSDTTLRAQLSQADAELARARAAIGQAESEISSTDAAASRASAALERAQRLNRSGNTTQALLDEAVAAGAAATAAAASAQGGLAVAQAGLTQAQAARDIAQLNLDRATVTAPADGIITERNARRGALAGASADPMFRLIVNGEVEMEGQILETALAGLEPGDPAEVNVTGVGNVQGKVRLIPASVDPVTRLGLVRVSLTATEGLRPGLFASASIILDERRAITVPSTAILADADGERVQVVRNDRVRTRPVRAGILWQDRREILDGLAEGEYVMTRAGAFFRDGDPVRPVSDQPKPAQPAPPTNGNVTPTVEASSGQPESRDKVR